MVAANVLGALAILAGALCLSSCGSPDDAAAAYAENAIKVQLKDPSTARLTGTYVVRKPTKQAGVEAVATCGLVDGKNSFGAYNGGTRYVVLQMSGAGGLSNVSATIDNGDKRATIGTENTDAPDTIFEKVYWNPYCVDEAHAAMHTGVKVE